MGVTIDVSDLVPKDTTETISSSNHQQRKKKKTDS